MRQNHCAADWFSQGLRSDIEIAVSKVAPLKGKPSRVVFGNPSYSGVAPLGQPFADDAENATFIAVTCNGTEWPEGPDYGDAL
jgi:hypothetical protein